MESLRDDEHAAWCRYVAAPSQRARSEIISRYADLARMHAAKLFADRQIAEIEFEEFHQYALVGLVEAVDRYDPKAGASFRTFASHRIRGAILNGIEKYCEKQQQIAARTRIREERFRDLLKEATSSEADPFMRLADIALGMAVGFMLENSGMYQGVEPSIECRAYRGREILDLSRILENLLATLPDQEQMVIRYHYQQHLRFDVIAAQMGLSKGRISQLHHRGLQRLREHYETLQFLRTDY